MRWDDTISLVAIREVIPTHRSRTTPPPTRNIALAAVNIASNEPVSVQYWINALNDGVVRQSPLPPDIWGSGNPHNPPQQWIQYCWPRPASINGSWIYSGPITPPVPTRASHRRAPGASNIGDRAGRR